MLNGQPPLVGKLQLRLLELGSLSGRSALFQMGTLRNRHCAIFGCFQGRHYVPVCACINIREIEIMRSAKIKKPRR